MKADFLFAGRNLNRIIQKKVSEKGIFLDDALKTRAIIYFNDETWLLFAPLSKFLATRLSGSVLDLDNFRILSQSYSIRK